MPSLFAISMSWLLNVVHNAHQCCVLFFPGVGENGEYMECSNLTIINFAIKLLGPINEGTLTKVLLTLQLLCSIVALVIRYPLARLFYDSQLFRDLAASYNV